MSQDAVERVLGRLITDERFRRAVGDSLEAACVREGYSLSSSELRFLSELGLKEISVVAARINPGLCRADTPLQSEVTPPLRKGEAGGQKLREANPPKSLFLKGDLVVAEDYR